MKKLIIFIALLALPVWALAAEDNLHALFKDKPVIKVFLENVKNSSGDETVRIEDFRNAFNEILRERVEFKFVPVKSAEEADVIVTADIVDFVFRDKVAPRFLSQWSIIADLSAPKNFSQIAVDYVVIDPKTGTVLFERKNFRIEERLPRKQFGQRHSYLNAIRKSIHRFLYRVFYRQEKDSARKVGQ